ncbi:MAG: nicotinamide-nucleotide adenylyltransferase [Promethearchaeota archaeon]
MKNELLACIKDRDIKYLHSGHISKYVFPMDRKEAHEKNISHLITRFFIFTISPSGEVYYLVQKRNSKKSSYPDYFTDSSSGHVLWAENLNLSKIKKDALRELEEEFGIPPKAIQKIKFYELIDEEDNKTKEIAYVFFGLVEYGISLNPDPDELDPKFSRFYNKNELEKLLENEKSVDYSKEIWRFILDNKITSLFKNSKDFNKSFNHEIALFIGRFQPLHHGHIYVLQNILKSYDKVKIGIGSSQLSSTPNDPFTGDEREEFLTAALKMRNVPSNRYQIYKIPDIFNATKWVEHVINIVGKFSVVVSNSDWIRELFQKEGYKIEKKIEIFKKKYNGNNIRQLIVKNGKWKSLLPKEVVDLIVKFDGINRIKSLSTTSYKS